MATAFKAIPEYEINSATANAYPRLRLSEFRGQLEDRIQALLDTRQRRTKFFADNLFADPAWDVLLQLALAEVQQCRISIVALCFGAGVPQTTALRWIKTMTDDGLLVREDDPLDARRKFIELSDDASSKMHEYLVGLDNVRPLRI